MPVRQYKVLAPEMFVKPRSVQSLRFMPLFMEKVLPTANFKKKGLFFKGVIMAPRYGDRPSVLLLAPTIR